jgi:multicomponent Na+:H+ antiporter subunit G
MNTILPIVGGLLLVLGAAFLFLGGLGLVRMPDVFNRIQAGTKATTLGTLLSLAGFACLQPDWALKLFLIGLFVLFTNPLSSQVLARAAHRSGSSMSALTSIDALAKDRNEPSGEPL